MYALLYATDPDESAVLTLVLQRAGLALRPVRDLDRLAANWPEPQADLLVVALKKSASAPQLCPWLSQFRQQTEAPVILILDPAEEDVQVSLLEIGADLLVCRPFSARLLIAQVRVLLRRSGGVHLLNLPVLSMGDLSLDPSERTVRVLQAEPVRLTQLEFRLLYTLMIHPGKVIPAETLVEQVWGYNGQGDRDLVRGLVKRLRAKVEPDPRSPVYIVTSPGVGYIFQLP